MLHWYAVCQAGPTHREKGIPCQDSFYVLQRDDGVIAAACADGVGSESRADAASKLAARVSVEWVAERFQPAMSDVQAEEVLRGAFAEADKAIRAAADEAGESVLQYGTTLCLAVVDGQGRVCFGQAGDSGIVALLKTGEYEPLTTQQREQGRVFPLRAGPDRWAFGERDRISALALVTDGLWDELVPPLLKNEAVKVHTALARSFLDRCEKEEEEIKTLEAAAGAFLEKYPWLDDDKTIVVIFGDEPAAKQADEYYAEPDWRALRRQALEKLRCG